VLLLKCKSCKETVAVAGLMHAVEEMYEGQEETVSVETLIPRMIEPPPKLFPIPKATPTEVTDVVNQAFRLYWFDRDACASRLRTAVELFLTKEGIADKRTNGAWENMSVRLSEYEAKEPSIGKKLQAVKWLGHTGTHRPGGVNLESINDALVIISAALEERYEHRKANELADEIIAKKGPRSPVAISKIGPHEST